MIRFLDGPAKGVTLQLRRAPIMLRVVRNHRSGEWDALDQPDDEAKPTEQIFVYRLIGRPHHYHLECARKSGSGFYWSGGYSFLPDQPDEQHVRTTKAWHEWCEANKQRLLAEIASHDSHASHESHPGGGP